MDACKREAVLTRVTVCSMRWSLFSLRAKNILSVFLGVQHNLRQVSVKQPNVKRLPVRLISCCIFLCAPRVCPHKSSLAPGLRGGHSRWGDRYRRLRGAGRGGRNDVMGWPGVALHNTGCSDLNFP